MNESLEKRPGPPKVKDGEEPIPDDREDDDFKRASTWRDEQKTDAAIYAVAKLTTFRADNRLMTKDHYDAAIKLAGSHVFR
jgi:hypothetical protein